MSEYYSYATMCTRSSRRTLLDRDVLNILITALRRNSWSQWQKTTTLALALFLSAIEGGRPENLSASPSDFVGLGDVLSAC